MASKWQNGNRLAKDMPQQAVQQQFPFCESAFAYSVEAVLARTKRQIELDRHRLMTQLETFGLLGLATPPGYSLYNVALLNVDGTTLRKWYCLLQSWWPLSGARF